MSFYLDYRPQLFNELDNEQVRSTLISLLGKPIDKLPHAFFLTGSKGTGKTTTARLLAKLFNCTKPNNDGSPCGTCEMCRSIAGGRAMDVLEIDAASNTGVDNIRELRQNIILAPSTGRKKVYIIDEVHMLSTGAFNALLKTLEEPPKHAIFILATTDPQKVPETIQSRCVPLVFTKPRSDELKNALKRIIASEKIDIDKGALDELISHSEGSFRDAVKLLEQISFEKGTITGDTVRSKLNLTEAAMRQEFIYSLSQKDAKKCLEIIQTITSNGIDLKTFHLQILSDLEEALFSLVQENTSIWQIFDLRDCIRRLNQAYGELRFSAIATLPLELAVVEYCYSTKEITNNELRSTKHEVRNQKHDPPAPAFASVNREAGVRSTNHEPSVTGSLSFITMDKLKNHWSDIVNETKPFNHMISGVLRSCKPVGIEGNTVIIEATSPFHLGKLKEPKVMEKLMDVMKKLFGEKPKIELRMR